MPTSATLPSRDTNSIPTHRPVSIVGGISAFLTCARQRTLWYSTTSLLGPQLAMISSVAPAHKRSGLGTRFDAHAQVLSTPHPLLGGVDTLAAHPIISLILEITMRLRVGSGAHARVLGNYEGIG